MSARDSFRGDQHVQVNTDLPGWVSLTLAPTLDSKVHLPDFLRPRLAGLADDLCEALLLATDELVSNAIEHGCRLEPDTRVDVALIRTNRMVLIYVRDDGAGFSLNELSHAAVTNPPNRPLQHCELRSQMGLRPGGFGIMVAKQVADELLYNQHGNIVLLIKYLD